MAATDNVQLVEKKELAKLGKAIGKLGQELGSLTEAFAAIAGQIEEPKKKKKRAKKAPTDAPTEQAAAPEQTQLTIVEQPPAPAKAAPVKAPVTKAALAKVPAKNPPKANGSTKMPKLPGAAAH